MNDNKTRNRAVALLFFVGVACAILNIVAAGEEWGVGWVALYSVVGFGASLLCGLGVGEG